jgi:AAA domain
VSWLDELDRRTFNTDNGTEHDEPEWSDNDPVFIHWPDLWDDEDHHEWLYEPVLALGRGHAIYAGHKQGKSLFVLWVCTQLAARGDTDIIYLDYEMTRDDLRERLEDMGHGPHSDLDRIHYALLPSLPPLDTGEGAGALLELIDSIDTQDRQLVVIIDTTSRAAQGDENSADTFREFYRWTGISLKRRGITWARLDHAGKDALKGQRGSSGKGDDVDIIWRLTQADEGGIKLHRDAARMNWVPETVTYTATRNPLGYDRTGNIWPAGTRELAAQLDRLEVPVDAGRPTARRALEAAAIPATNAVLAAAIRYRKQPEKLSVLESDSPKIHVSDSPADTPKNDALTSTDSSPDSVGQSVDGKGPVSVSLDTDRSTRDQSDPYELAHNCTRCTRPATDISGLCASCLNPGTLPPLNPEELF